VPVASIKADVSTMFPHADASGTVPYSWAALKSFTHVVPLKDEGIGSSGRAIDRQKFRALKVCFLLKNH
jgi:hypothetical protein